MANPKAFLTIDRKEAGYRPMNERVTDFGEVEQTLNTEDRVLQASRCMECGIAFCHWACPLGNKMPEWQDAVWKGKWKEAYRLLEETNDFPEFTGRICPALCEKACVLALSFGAVTIRENEAAIAERAFEEGHVVPVIPKQRTGKRVAVIGSGPAGLAVANQLNRKGHSVTVFEKDEFIGGLLRLGIPDFKLSKLVINRRVHLMKEEGVEFIASCEVGKDIPSKEVLGKFDAVCIAIGSGVPRDLPIEGRELNGVHFALDFLKQQNRQVAGSPINGELISAKGKNVLVIGGGDTGSDCIGTSIRQGAKSVTQIEIMPKPPVGENPATPWPNYPVILKTTSSHQEGGDRRRWLLETLRFIGENGNVKAAEVREVEWGVGENGRMTIVKTGKPEIIEADLVLLSMGFVHPVQEGLVQDLGLATDERKNIQSAEGVCGVKKVFVAGDASYGASLVVRAIDSGRRVAAKIDRFLTGV